MWRFLLRRNDKLHGHNLNSNTNFLKKPKTSSIAPIEVKILLWWGSPQKIETDSGTSGLLKTKISASKNLRISAS
ncbi:hypothetical protein B0A75_14360 [Flavobacterium oncorhynchi]|uniref:Uncharacterized protein n=1 Tax=Flavobacterium oncorhynchi TaxID=728056 RepID=A0A226HWX0_9FLAO|nr:hypothetical protein B0A75_14360 [Flavobacterium oncorhynchi]